MTKTGLHWAMVCFLVAGLVGLLPDPAPAQQPFIDAHAHLFGEMRNAGAFKDFPAAARAAVETMDRHGIRKTLIMPPPFNHLQPQRYTFEEFKAALDEHPGRFGFLGGGGSLNAMIQAAVSEGKVGAQRRQEFEARTRAILAAGALGFGEMTAEHLSMTRGHPYETAPPDHPLFLLLADIAAELKVPIDIHMEAVPEDMDLPAGYGSSANPARLKANIAPFERLLAHNPKAKIIWAHLGWDNTGQRTVALTRRLLAAHPNLYMSFKLGRRSRDETRPVARGVGLKKDWLALLRDFPDRFIIGSDNFHMAPGAIGRMPNRMKPIVRFISVLPPDLAQKICLDNPRALFKLK